MKNCELVNLNLCTGCTGLAEKDWIGKEKCSYYQKYWRNKKKRKERVDDICI